MYMKETISHIGIVEQVSHTQVQVAIVSQTACSGCHAQGACGMVDETQKTLYIPCDFPHDFSIGERVEVHIAPQAAFVAVWYAYILPFIVVFAVLLVSNQFVHEILAAAITFASVTIYFVVLSKYKAFIHKKITFQLVHTA